MDKKEEFKNFLKSNRYLSKLVNEGKTTYQKLYETYDIYGPKDEIWNGFRKETSTFSGAKDILSNLKNIDIDKLEENVGSLEKALTFLEDIMSSRSEKQKEKREREVKPSEIERFFDD